MMEWLSSLEWSRLWPELIGKFLGFAAGFAASWYLLFRKRLKALERLKSGDSDDVLFQAHYLLPKDGDDVLLLFRNVAPSTTLEKLYDNPAAREVVKELAEQTSLKHPILKTQGTVGYEICNDAFNHIAGQLASAPFPREKWLFVMTCEDRQVVRRKCIRCFLMKPADLERLRNWDWCKKHVLCEQPWHYFRIVALHQIAAELDAEEARERAAAGSTAMPLIDNQAHHRRIRPLSAGIFSDEIPIAGPNRIPWEAKEAELKKLGVSLRA